MGFVERRADGFSPRSEGIQVFITRDGQAVLVRGSERLSRSRQRLSGNVPHRGLVAGGAEAIVSNGRRVCEGGRRLLEVDVVERTFDIFGGDDLLLRFEGGENDVCGKSQAGQTFEARAFGG